MRLGHLLLSAAVVLGALVASGVATPGSVLASGITWNVNAATGSDPTDGSCPSARVYKTLTYLFNTCSSAQGPQTGDTVNVAAGTYSGGFTIKNSMALAGAGAGSTVISGATVTVSTAISAAPVTISGVTITNAWCCSGLINHGTAILDHSAVIKNTGSNLGGGGITNDGHLTVQYSTVAHNVGLSGAGIATGGSTGATDNVLTVISSTIDDNGAGFRGGGIYSDNYNNTSKVYVYNSTLTGNTAEQGGAIFDGPCQDSMTIVNSTIARNKAMQQGGGILTNPMCGFPATLTPDVSISNTILAQNSIVGVGPTGGPDCSGTLTDGGYNLLGDNAGCSLGGNHNLIGSPGSLVDPKLASLDSYGGPTQTMGLLSGSPAIGAGSAGTCSSSPINNVDQRGSSRGTPTRTVCDIGAYDTYNSSPPVPHTPANWYVNTSGSDAIACGANNSSTPFKTIAAALACASDGDSINLAVSSTPYDVGGSLSINKSVSLVGQGASKDTIQGIDPVISVAGSYTVAISGVTIHPVSARQGLVNNGVLTLDHVVVTGGSKTYGGGIGNQYILQVQDSTIERNSGTYGGGIANDGALTVLRSAIIHNSASNSGGGVHTYGGPYTWASTLLVNSTVSENSVASGANSFGGGVYQGCDQMVVLVNTTVSYNSAGQGGGVYASGGCFGNPPGQVKLSNTILAANSASSSGPDCMTNLGGNGTTSAAITDGTGAHNIIGNSSGCSTPAGSGDQIGAGSPIDAGLAPLGYYGGPTATVGLRASSRAIGAGDTPTCQSSASDTMAAGVSGQDQRGDGRGSPCDVGAFDTHSTGPVETVSLALQPGWVMIGGSPLTVFQDAASTWRWDATTGAWSQPEGNEAEGAGAWEEVSATETELVAVRSCTTNPAVTVFPHRWNMVGNPCDRPVDLPGDARALLWNGSGYTVSQSIPAGMAAWVLPGSPSLVLTPGWGTFPDQPIPHVPGPKEGDAYARTNRPFPQGAGADQSARYRLHCSLQLLTLAISLDMLL